MASTEAIRPGGQPLPPRPSVLRVASLGKHYAPEGPPALPDVTFDVGEGEFLAVIGPSGCGKTTLLRILSGLIRPSEGTVLLDGRPVVGPPPEVSLVFQDYSRSLFPWLTVLRNVMFPLRRRSLSRREGRARRGRSSRPRSPGRRAQVPLAALRWDGAAGSDRPFARVAAEVAAARRAVYLGDRVLVLSSAPGRVLGSIEVDLARPRAQAATRSSPRFLAVRNEIHQIIRGSQ